MSVHHPEASAVLLLQQITDYSC